MADTTSVKVGLYKKGQSRLYLLRRLRSFGVQGPLLKFCGVVSPVCLGEHPGTVRYHYINVPPLDVHWR